MQSLGGNKEPLREVSGKVGLISVCLTLGLEAHTYIPSYLGDGDRTTSNGGSRPAWAKFARLSQNQNKNKRVIRYQWFTPVILATWEAEIRRTGVQGEYRQIVLQTPSPK
jgi:hypothetical protein